MRFALPKTSSRHLLRIMHDPRVFRGYYEAAVDYRLRRLAAAAEGRGDSLDDMDRVIVALERACRELEGELALAGERPR